MELREVRNVPYVQSRFPMASKQLAGRLRRFMFFPIGIGIVSHPAIAKILITSLCFTGGSPTFNFPPDCSNSFGRPQPETRGRGTRSAGRPGRGRRSGRSTECRQAKSRRASHAVPPSPTPSGCAPPTSHNTPPRNSPDTTPKRSRSCRTARMRWAYNSPPARGTHARHPSKPSYSPPDSHPRQAGI